MRADAFPVDDVRRRFPALERSSGFLFFDNAAGAQIPDTVLDAVTDHLLVAQRAARRTVPPLARGRRDDRARA